MESSSEKRKSSRQTPEFQENLTSSSNDSQGYNKKQKVLLDSTEIVTDAKTSSPEDDRSSIKIADLDNMEIEKDDFNLSTKNKDSTSCSYDLGKASELARTQTKGVVTSSEWKPFEKELYLKGIEIFGRNSCLITRNLLPILKTCLEVSTYMNQDVAAKSQGSTGKSDSFFVVNGNVDAIKLEQGIPSRPRLFRRRGKSKTRKLKYSWKSAGHPSFWRRIADGKNHHHHHHHR